jgi:hypothetical protein
MHRDIFEITNKGLGFKLINSTSFGESMICVGFIQETADDGNYDMFLPSKTVNICPTLGEISTKQVVT